MLPETKIQEMQETQDETKEVETSNIDLSAEIEVKDSEADSNVPSAPPPRNVYPFQWRLNSEKGGQELGDGTVLPKGIAVGIDKNKKPFITVHLLGKLTDDSSEFNGFPVSDQRNSIVFAGRPTSDIHSILAKLGKPVSNKISLLNLINHIYEVFSEEPIGLAELDWRYNYKDEESGKWVNQASHMEQFPPTREDPNNPKSPIIGYSNIIESKKDGEDGYASAYILKHVAR